MGIDTTINISILISACLAIVGWIVNNILNRRHEIAKRRLEYRLEALHSFIPVIKAIQSLAQNNTYKQNPALIEESHIKFQLYGTQEENEIFNEIIKYGNENDTTELVIKTEKLAKIVLTEIRNELKLTKLK